jgi:hypothetical protein
MALSVMQELVKSIRIAEDERSMNERMGRLAEVIRLCSSPLRQPAVEQPKKIVYDGIKSAISDAMAGEAQARAGVTLIREGLYNLLVSTRGQEGENAFALLQTALKRYSEVTGTAVAAGEADYLAKRLENQTDAGVQAYAARLHESFPQP